MYSVLCFVAREPGMMCLEQLSRESKFQIKAVYTHRKKPSAEDPLRHEREDYIKFLKFCKARALPCSVVDTTLQAERLADICNFEPFDFIVSCNWKFLIPERILSKAKIGTVNLHRGKIPEYRGLEPIKRALTDGQDKIFLSAHVMEREYDTGRILSEHAVDVNRIDVETIDQAVDRLKTEILPLYPLAMLDGLNILINEHKS